MKALLLPIALSLLAALRAQDPPSCPLEPQKVSLVEGKAVTCGGRVTRPVSGGGPWPQAPYRKGSGGRGLSVRLSVKPLLSPGLPGEQLQLRAQGSDSWDPRWHGCTLRREDTSGAETAPRRRWASCLCLALGAPHAGLFRPTLDTRGADVLEPSLHWGRQVVGADANLACPTQEAHSLALLRSQELGM